MPKKPRFTVEKISDQIYHVKYQQKKHLTSDFMRYEEYYESPKFAGKIFTRAQFKRWYAKTYGNGKFTYFTDWVGFNVPGYAFQHFASGRMNPLTKNEQAVLEALMPMADNSYVIATSGEDKLQFGTLKHEMGHAFYRIDQIYRSEAMTIVDKIPHADLDAIFKIFKKMGYTDAVLEDEAHAYLLEGMDRLGQELDVYHLMPLHLELQNVFLAAIIRMKSTKEVQNADE